MAETTKLGAETHPGAASEAPPQTIGFRLNHTMLRVKDPSRSLDFYTRVLGMRVLRRLDFEEMKFSLYFLRYAEEGDLVPPNPSDRTKWMFRQSGILELTHNWGTEERSEFTYHHGNAEPQGFGHLCISVLDLADAERWFDSNDVRFVKRPQAGKMKNIAFIGDPDGYWIEIVQADLLGDLGIG